MLYKSNFIFIGGKQMTQVISGYGISQTDFYNLYSANARDIDSAIIEKLKESASRGNIDSIDLLQNLALRNDEVGETAEKALFGLYCGRQSSAKGVDVEIAKSSLMLYEKIDRDKFSQSDRTNKLTRPSAVLFMAGAATPANSEIRDKIASVFSGAEVSQNVHERVGKDDLWASNRFISDAELTASSMGLDASSKGLSVNRPVGLVDPVSGENKLVDLFFEKMDSQGDNFLKEPELVAVNTKDHWVLLGIYPDENGERNAIIFDSKPPLSVGTKERFDEVAQLCGCKPIEYLAMDLQQNVPNGCGLFVDSVMKSIAEGVLKKTAPSESVHAFVEMFTAKSPAEQEDFNRSRRLQLRENLIFS
ncbi:ElaD/SseL family deubiquitinase [Dongshaea marina]|uniref:ElaD/SseL family deubiquitinase n=1 Tax=Dongshaea marina TaxID=2047966 RepID=UPI000D3E2775|nr:ElaD/SseL family deubiquitinase [Dongshaea marina]